MEASVRCAAGGVTEKDQERFRQRVAELRARIEELNAAELERFLAELEAEKNSGQ